jgi:serpin B
VKCSEAVVLHPVAMSAAIRSRAEAASALYSQLASEDDGNTVVALHPLLDVLSMLYAGAADETAAEMRSALGFAEGPECHPLAASAPQATSEQATYAYATRLWTQHGVELTRSYLLKLSDVAASNGGGLLEQADFARAPDASCKAVNAWVAEQTRGKIRDLLQPADVTSLTRLVITSACFFKAQWQQRLSVEGKLSFTAASGAQQVVDALCCTTGHSGRQFLCARTGLYDAVRLPYEGINVGMVLMKPRTTLRELRRKLTGVLSGLMADASRRPLDLTMPRFKISQAHDVTRALRALGATRMFDENLADFSNMATSPELHVSVMRHEAWIAVDEEGTEGGGAVAAVVSTRCLPPPTFELVLDAPFIFVVQDESTGAPLLIGQVNDLER